jgi:hypothetical protein
MHNPDLIRRQWPGFGECRITVSPREVSGPGSLAERIFAGVPRLLSRNGLGCLRFTVDPTWILHDHRPLAGPLVSQFLRVHRRALAEEWQSRQHAHSIPAPPPQNLMAVPVWQEAEPDSTLDTPQPALRPQGDKGLPTWFELCCTPTRIRN